MITLIYYYCIYLLIVYCQSDFIDSEVDYTNDSPYILPKVEVFRHKFGTDILLKCNLDQQHFSKNGLTWEFKPCESNYKGVQCNTYDMYKVEDADNLWKKLDYSRGRKRLEIHNSSEEHNGLYRCIYNEAVRRIYMVEIVDPTKYSGPPPEVLSLIPTNSVMLQNTNFVIQCKIASVIPPTILWFKECYGRRCDVREMDHCFCHINTNDSIYSNGNNYFSKINIYNARDIDSGLYACLAVSVYGKDYKNISIKVMSLYDETNHKSLSWLFLIPLTLILIPITVWLCYYRKKKKSSRVMVAEQQKKLIRPVMQVDIVLERNEIV